MRFKVENPGLLAELVGSAVQQRFDGNVARAARFAGLVPSHLVKLRNRRASWINGSTRVRIERLMPAEQRGRLDEAVAARAIPGAGAYSGAAGDFQYEMLITVLRMTFREEFDAFERWLATKACGEEQIQVSYHRVVSPLLDRASQSAFQLSRDTLRQFLMAGIQRERVILGDT